MNNNKYHYVYIIENIINNYKYIGRHFGLVDDSYMGSGKRLKRMQSKFGIQNFKKRIIIICNNRSHAVECEEFYIKQADAVNSIKYYNLVYGGDSIFSKEERYNHKMYSMNAKQRKTYHKKIERINSIDKVTVYEFIDIVTKDVFTTTLNSIQTSKRINPIYLKRLVNRRGYMVKNIMIYDDYIKYGVDYYKNQKELKKKPPKRINILYLPSNTIHHLIQVEFTRSTGCSHKVANQLFTGKRQRWGDWKVLAKDFSTNKDIY